MSTMLEQLFKKLSTLIVTTLLIQNTVSALCDKETRETATLKVLEWRIQGSTYHHSPAAESALSSIDQWIAQRPTDSHSLWRQLKNDVSNRAPNWKQSRREYWSYCLDGNTLIQYSEEAKETALSEPLSPRRDKRTSQPSHWKSIGVYYHMWGDVRVVLIFESGGGLWGCDVCISVFGPDNTVSTTCSDGVKSIIT